MEVAAALFSQSGAGHPVLSAITFLAPPFDCAASVSPCPSWAGASPRCLGNQGTVLQSAFSLWMVQALALLAGGTWSHDGLF